MATFFSCEKNKVEEPLAGKPGNPRLNLVFTNEENVDLDLHVLTPNGKEIYYSNLSADGGELDVDCKCSTCPSGPNENVFWVEGTAPPGIYKYWVEYYNHCSISGSVSNYTLRRLTNSKVEETFTGTLSVDKQKSPIYTFEIKPWYSSLPDCPCKYTDVQRLNSTTNPAGKWEVTNGSYLTQYHYGASFEARWTPSIGGRR